jgi:uncharacterized protein YigA (DUF484 family)
MSTANKAEAELQSINAKMVADFLGNHPNFFEGHPYLLHSLELSHSTGAPRATSLIERQVTVLREKNKNLEHQLRELIDVARGNDDLASKIDALAIKLLAAHNRDEIVSVLEATLRGELLAEHAVMVLFLPSATDREPETRFLRVIDRGDEALTPFKTFLEMGSPRCGYIRDTQRDFLFGAGNIEIGSAALVPLGDQCVTGFLAIGSRDADYFNPGQSMDFLARMGDLITAALSSR